MVQDAGGDVVALCENPPSPPSPTPGGTPEATTVAAQWTYDAYGSALTAEHLAAHPLVHVGHKGLFFDRLDVGVVSTLGTELPRLAPYAHLVVQMRNRAYLPGLGRFLQRDSNATAMALIEASAMHGRGLGAIAAAFDMQGMYGDGGNLYAYLGSNPCERQDALGLMWGDFAIGNGFRLGRLAHGILSQYSSNLYSDLEWAGDWSQDDDAHTRGDNEWVDELIGNSLREADRDLSMGPIDDLLDLFGAAADVLEYLLIGDDGDGAEVYNTPTMASDRLPFKRSVPRLVGLLGGHGQLRHQVLMAAGARWVRGHSVRLSHMRMNQALYDPIKGVTVSKLRADVQGFKPPNIFYVSEACVSQSVSAARAKWADEEPRLRRLGYKLITPNIQR